MKTNKERKQLSKKQDFPKHEHDHVSKKLLSKSANIDFGSKQDNGDLANEVFMYANTLTKTIHHSNKAQTILHDKITSLTKDIQESKQNVVKHVINSRILEKKQVQVKLVEQALQDHLKAKNAYSDGKYSKIVYMIKTGHWSFDLDDYSIYKIESSVKINGYTGFGKVSYETFRDFSTLQLEKTLDLFDTNLKSNAQKLNKFLFTRVATAASNSRIDEAQTHKIYKKSELITNEVQKHRKYQNIRIEEILWRILKAQLIKKIVLLHLTVNVLSSPDFSMNNSKTQLPSIQPNPTIAETPIKPIESLNSSLSSGFLPSIANPGLTPSVLSPGKVRPKDTAVKGRKGNLHDVLTESNKRQEKIQEQITNNVLSAYSDLFISQSFQGQKGKATKNTTFLVKRSAVEKLCAGLNRHYRKVLTWAIPVWRRAAKLNAVEMTCARFLHQLAAWRLLSSFERVMVRLLLRTMRNFRRFLDISRAEERGAAVTLLQKHWRGFLVRHQIKTTKRLHSAILLQTHMRIYLAKKRVAAILYRRELERCARMIQRKWRSLEWQRTLKKLFRRQLENRKAVVIQRHYRGRLGRRRFQRVLAAFKRFNGALRFQCLWRRYRAVVRVSKLRGVRGRWGAVVMIQKVVRGYLSRLEFKTKWEAHVAVKRIQYSWWGYRARQELLFRRRSRAAVQVQRVVRGKLGRNRFLHFVRLKQAKKQRRWDALSKIGPVVVGHLTRKRWKQKLIESTERRRKAGLVLTRHSYTFLLGMRARRYVRELRAELKQAALEYRSVIKIQRVTRGAQGRKKAIIRRKEWEVERERANRIPFYYRTKNDYYLTQNMFHRPFVLKIQCMVRRRLARNKVERRKRFLAAKKIQKMCRAVMAKIKALKEIEEIKRKRRLQVAYVLRIQRVGRGFIGRSELKRHKKIMVVKGFLQETHVVNIVRRAKRNFRIRKERENLERYAATQIQKIARGRQTKAYFKRNYRRLVRQRNLRIKEKRERMAVKVQSLFRMNHGKKATQKKRWQKAQQDREAAEYEEVERSLDGLHEDWMTELMVIRAQTGARAMLAKAEFMKRLEAYKKQQQKEKEEEEFLAVASIQALVRGVLGRKAHRKNLPFLKKAAKQRSYCVECEIRVAVKRCRDCKDKYCDDCFKTLHRKGRRKQHGWDPIVLDARAQQQLNQELNPPEENSKTHKNTKKDWQEFYDSSARAKYWFNNATGEASWICPY